MLKIKKKILKLKKKILWYEFNYFIKNKNIISNEKYDFLIKKLEKLENKYPTLKTNNSPTKNINYKFLKTFSIKKHNINMLSIKNIYSYKELYKYVKKIKKIYNTKIFCCELKIDGIAISLLYENNYLIKALTRGNGKYGEDITKNIKCIKCIPKNINIKEKFRNLEIRGEIFISKKEFININKKNIFSNSRNITSGTIRQSNKDLIKKRNLSFVGYDIYINYQKKNLILQNKCLKKIKKLGFYIDKNTKICNNILKIKNFYKKIKKNRKIFNFEIDGIVIKVNNINIQKKLGNNNKYIKWAIAWKFPSKKSYTKILNIKYKVSKNGTIIPIANIKTTYINGIKIKNINLYNLNYLSKLSLSINNKIIIERSGDVIPKLYRIIKCKNNKIKIPNKCPYCKSKINIKEKLPKCFNLNCYKKIENIIINFISKKGFNIINFGKKTIKKLIKYKYIKNILDIFYISKKKLIKIPGIKNKLANKIILSIKLSIKNIKLNNLIYSLSIPYIGISTSKKISKKIKTFNNFIKIKKNNLIKIKKLEKYKINSIIKYIKNKNNINILKKIKKIINI